MIVRFKSDFLRKLRVILSRRDKLFLLFLLLFTLVVSGIETVGISAIMPFVSIATDFNLVKTNKYYSYVYRLFHFSSPAQFVIYFGIVLILFYILRVVINITYFYYLNRFSYGRYHIIATRLFNRYLSMPYKDFVDRNTSSMIKAIVTETMNITLLVTSFLLLLSEVFVVVFIYTMLLFVQWKMTLLLTVVLTLKVLIITRVLSRVTGRLGERRNVYQGLYYRVMNEAFSDFKFIKLVGIKDSLVERFSDATREFARTNMISYTISQSPRLLLEMVGFSVLIGVVLYVIYKYNSAKMVIPIVSMYAVAFYRLLPSINRILSSYNQIVFYVSALDIIYKDLFLPVENPGYKDISFNREIRLFDVGFLYGSNCIFKDINLTIKKGQRFAIIGESGIGKTTLLDIIIGMNRPTYGKVLIDGVELTEKNVGAWRSKIGYIPQEVYLFDGTVKDNVVFGRDFDEDRLIDCLKKANIYDFLESKDGIYTIVGEGGVKLSGGQRQRIAIARALYGDPEILVLDEATSSLDKETEKRILDEIFAIGKDKTLIIVTHRTETVKDCDVIFELR